MIRINTDTLKEMAATSKAASAEMSSAGDLLNQITTHNDWGCSERVVINDRITSLRAEMRKLQESSERFDEYLGMVTEQFVEVENSIPVMFESVEALLRSILAVPVGEVAKGGDISDQIIGAANVITEAVSVVNMADLKL